MKARISFVNGNQPTVLESLCDWLRGEPALAGRVRTLAAAPRDGELGVLGDALVVSVGSGGALSALALSLKAWLLQPHGADIRIRIEGQAGQIVEIDADRVNGGQVEALVRQVLGSGVLEK